MKNAFYGVEKVHKFIYRSQKFSKLSIDTSAVQEPGYLDNI